jgi:hypothetical protein
MRVQLKHAAVVFEILCTAPPDKQYVQDYSGNTAQGGRGVGLLAGMPNNPPAFYVCSASPALGAMRSQSSCPRVRAQEHAACPCSGGSCLQLLARVPANPRPQPCPCGTSSLSQPTYTQAMLQTASPLLPAAACRTAY